MQRSLFVALLCLIATRPSTAQGATVLYPGLEGGSLLTAIRADFTPARALGYDVARDSLFAFEQRTTGGLRCVYTGYTIQLTPGADPSMDAYSKGISTEHTFPQSRGSSGEPSRSDMHHLFPTREGVNSARGNLPFAEIPDAFATGWYRLGASQSSVPSVFLDEWSERSSSGGGVNGGGRFEPREDHKGDAARAVLYFSTVYASQIAAARSESFFDQQLQDLLKWNALDPPSEREIARDEWIAAKQGTRNPFIVDTTLARRAYRGGSSPPPPPPPPPAGSARLVWINEIHYDNAGNDSGEGVEIAGPAGTDLSGWGATFYNGSSGATYDSINMSGFIPDAGAGFGAVWFPIAGLQNGAPDGIALVAPNGTVAQFLSYEGVMTAVGGPADGLESTDIGVSETGTTPEGFSLQLSGTGSAYADFVWAEPALATPGQVNVSQTFLGGTAVESPAALALLEIRVFPNPSTGSASVRLSLREASELTLQVYDAIGRIVVTPVSTQLGAGAHVLPLDLTALPRGVYVVRASSAGGSALARVVVQR